MQHPPDTDRNSSARFGVLAKWLAVLAAVAVPLSLLWDYSWEFTIGVETLWAPPHLATYAAVGLAALVALGWMGICTGRQSPGVRLGGLRAPLGVWLVLWGGLAFVTASIFDRWWQLGYGQSAGIWHPPQLLKAAAFFAIVVGAWFSAAEGQRAESGSMVLAVAGGAVMAMIFVVTLPSNLANRQHSAALYEIAGGTYPIVLVAAARSARWRFSATATALCFMLIAGAAVWGIPLQAAQPQAGPIFRPRDHLLPPPFPLLLVVPAVALDLLVRVFPAARRRGGGAVEAGLAFFFTFTAAQWPFAAFLLSPAADNRFFAGGGVHWPPMQPISDEARVSFWPSPGWELNARHMAVAIGLAIVAAAIGNWLGVRMGREGRDE